MQTTDSTYSTVFKSNLENYFGMVGVVAASLVIGFALNYFVIAKVDSFELEFGLIVILVVVTAFAIRRFVHTITIDAVKIIIYFVACLSILFSNISFVTYVRNLSNSTKVYTDFGKAVKEGREKIFVKNAPKVNTDSIGRFATHKISRHRYYSIIYFNAYIVYPITGMKDTYYGLCINSDNYDASLSNDEINQLYIGFVQSLNTIIPKSNKEKPSGYYELLTKHTIEYEDYGRAVMSCKGNYFNPDNVDLSYTNYKIYIDSKGSTQTLAEESLNILIWLLTGTFVIISVLFAIGKKKENDVLPSTVCEAKPDDEKKVNETKLDDDINLVSEILSPFVKLGWRSAFTLGLMALFVVYYVHALVNGYNNVLLNNNNSREIIQFGALSKDMLSAGEWWRLITAPLMHVNVCQLGANLVSLYFFMAYNRKMCGSVKFIAAFFILSIITEFAFMFTEPSFSPIVGASGGIMGLYGFRFYNIASLSLYNIKINLDFVKDKEPTDNIGSILIDFIPESMFVIMPTFVVNLYFRISVAPHILGFIVGIVIGYVMKHYIKNNFAIFAHS